LANILIVDENDFYREFLSTAVARQGHAAYQLAHGQEVLAALARWRIDLVLADVLPAPSLSFETVRAIKAAYPGLPVIALAEEVVGTRGLYERLAQRAGAICALSKAAKPAALAACITQVLASAGRGSACGPSAKA
jgi:CheY-like chemotaxis protein